MDLPDISSIEVLKGPQGTLFGRNATGGAILINTLDPSFEFQARTNVEAGVYTGGAARRAEHLVANGFFTGPIVENVLAGSVSAWSEYTPGYVDEIRTGARIGETTVYGLRGKLLWTPSANTDVQITGYYVDRDDNTLWAGSVYRDTTVGAARNPDGTLVYSDAVWASNAWQGAYGFPEEPSFNTESYGVSVRVSHDIESLGTLTSTTAYNDSTHKSKTSSVIVHAPSCYAAFACLNYHVNTPDVNVSQELLFTSEQFEKLQFVSGLFGFYNKAEEHDFGYAGIAGDMQVFEGESEHVIKSAAAFMEFNYELTGSLTATAGARFTYESRKSKGSFSGAPLETYADKSWNNVSPRLSLLYAVNDELNLYATYSQGFKGGTSSTFPSPNNPIADPEKLTAYEVGAKYATPAFSMSAALFYYDYEDKQEEVIIERVVNPRNAAEAEVIGVDLDATWQITPEFQTRFGVSWLPRARFSDFENAIVFQEPMTPTGLIRNEAFDASGSRLLKSPKVTTSLSGTYITQTDWGMFDATATLYYSSDYRYEFTGFFQQSSYTTLNAQIGIVPKWNEKLRIGVYGRNLTNESYMVGNRVSASHYFSLWGPPRELGVALQWNY